MKSYTDGVTKYLRWCTANGVPLELSKAAVQTFITDLLDQGQTPKTVTARLTAVRRFSTWLTEEGNCLPIRYSA